MAAKKISPYTVTLETGGQTYIGKGTTIIEALHKIQPNVFKAKGKIVASNGTVNAELFLRPIQMRRLAVNAMTQEIIGKRLATLLS